MHSLVTLTNHGDCSAWWKGLASAGRYDTYHLPGYQRLTTPDGYETVLLRYEARGTRLTLPLTLRPLPDPVRQATGFTRDATSVYGYPGPLLTDVDRDGNPGDADVDAGTDGSTHGSTDGGVDGSTDGSTDGWADGWVDDEWRAGLTQWLGSVCVDLSVLSVFIRNHPILDASAAFTHDPFAVSPATPTVAVDLTRDEDDRLARASSHHRRALRKSLRHGLTFAHDHGEDAIAGFTTCYAETMDRRDAPESYRLDRDRVAAMVETLGEHAELWVARMPDGTVVSAGLFLVTGEIVQYHLGGTPTEYLALGAARPLFEAVARSGHERGLRWFHLGGGVGGDGDSLLRYKAGFGPDRFDYRTIRTITDPDAYAEGTRAVGLDPSRGFFPAYRTGGMGV